MIDLIPNFVDFKFVNFVDFSVKIYRIQISDIHWYIHLGQGVNADSHYTENTKIL